MSETYIALGLRRIVRLRANGRCEYCLIADEYALMSHCIDHILAEKHGGVTEENNLALACPPCNLRKGSDLATIDPKTGELVPLYHPRKNLWSEHFELLNGRLIPLSQIADVTIRFLRLNDNSLIIERLMQTDSES